MNSQEACVTVAGSDIMTVPGWVTAPPAATLLQLTTLRFASAGKKTAHLSLNTRARAHYSECVYYCQRVCLSEHVFSLFKLSFLLTVAAKVLKLEFRVCDTIRRRRAAASAASAAASAASAAGVFCV